MIEPFVTSLLLIAQPVPAITCAEKNEAGECVYDYARKPRLRVHALHTEKVAEIYRAYFQCHSFHVLADERFGTSNGEAAIALIRSATVSCASEREAADRLVDDYLVTQKIYGDLENRILVRDRFRQEAGFLFLNSASRTAGREREYHTVIQAITDELVPAND